MAALFITEYSRLAIEWQGFPVLVGLEPSRTQTAEIGAGSVQVTLNAGTKFVRLHAKAICHVKFGLDAASAVATSSELPMALGQTEFFGVKGTSNYVAVIQGV